jgi:1-acyl-sn-glycerol-3-phosphate acyltransferase
MIAGRMIAGGRALAFNVAFVGMTIGLGVFCLPLLPMPRRASIGVIRAWAQAVLWLMAVLVGLRYRITGAEHMPRAGAALIAAQHQSAFDTIVWLALLPDCAYVLKRELLLIPLYGWYARRAGMISVDRAAGASAMRGLLKDGQAALAAGRQVVIFPEGTRVAPGVEAPYQPGIAALYARAKLPVLPVGTDSGKFWGRRAFLKRPGVITIALAEPIPPGLGREAFLTLLRARIETAPGQPNPVDKSGESGL